MEQEPTQTFDENELIIIDQRYVDRNEKFF